MAGDGPHSSRASRSSLERTACDKCRSQKLRCVRDEQADNGSLRACRRCVNAGLVCVTSPPKPLGRHSIRRTRVAGGTSLATSPRAGTVTDVNQKGQMDIQALHARTLGTRPSDPGILSSLSVSSPIVNHPETKLSDSSTARNKDDNSLVESSSEKIDVQSCRLNLSLSQQVMALEAAPEPDTDLRNRILDGNVTLPGSGEKPQAAQTSPIHLVLDSTSQFLGILQHRSQHSINLEAQNTEPGNKGDHHSREHTEPYGPSQHAEPWIFHAFMPQASPPASESPVTSTIPKRQAQLSTSTLLTLASCHFHLITIYDILFQKIHLALRDTSPSLLKASQFSPGLELAGFLAQNSGMPVKTLIEVMKHQLELIEKGLGLPDMYRVHPRSYQFPKTADSQEIGENRGIFDGAEAKACLESAMRLNDQAAIRRILSLREILDKVLGLTASLR